MLCLPLDGVAISLTYQSLVIFLQPFKINLKAKSNNGKNTDDINILDLDPCAKQFLNFPQCLLSSQLSNRLRL